MEIKKKKCRANGCQNEFQPFRTTDKFCSLECTKKSQKPGKPKKTTRINPISKKRRVEQLQYSVDRIVFLAKPENKICFVDGCDRPSNTIEHRAGRIGKNYLDQSTWAGCCLEHNLEFENNPELSKKYQLSRFHNGEKISKKSSNPSIGNGD